MKTSELIKELSEVIAEYGDLPAFYFDGARTHEPGVTAALHRTGNETWIWEAPEQPLSESDADTILEKASLQDLEWARKTIGQLDRGNVAAAALILVRVQSIEKARRVLAMYGERPRDRAVVADPQLGDICVVEGCLKRWQSTRWGIRLCADHQEKLRISRRDDA